MLGRPLTVTAGAEGSALGAAALGLHAVGARPSLATALSALAPDLLEPHHDETLVASPTTAAAYDLARVSAAQRLRDLAAAADLLAGPRRPSHDSNRQPSGNKRQLVVSEAPSGLH